MDDVKAKQQIVEKIKSSTNILVTVSNNPSVDALSAALGLTLLLDKLDKHVTSIFSGDVPPAISFLEPEKTFDNTTDSLRDFIIALDKEKADHLRYKVEGDSVKIFITPYKTTITGDDLQFSQGDYNVELVIALGVDNQDHLDAALDSHGQILHDAAIVAVTAGDKTSTLGGIDWHDAQASSLSEMLSGLAEALKTDKTKSLLDAPVSTAFLTGIVAETDRFSNTHTTARVMTTAAQLMAAGADQQLIAMKLQESHEIGNDTSEESTEDAPEVKETSSKESLSINHDETLEELDKRVKKAEQADATVAATDALQEETGEVAETPASTPEEPAIIADSVHVTNAYGPDASADVEPTLGGSLNATTEQAAEDSRNEVENDQNKTILSHSYLASSPSFGESVNGASEENAPDPLATPESATIGDALPEAELHSAYASEGETVIQPLAPEPVAAPAPADLGLPMPPAIPDFSQAPVVPPIIEPPVVTSAYGMDPIAAPAQPEILGDILAPEPIATPVVEPALPPAPAPLAPPASTPVNPNDPGQFKIPGQ